MSEHQDAAVNDSEHPFSPEDERLFEVLNQYLELIHQGEIITRSQMLLAHPELAGLIGTLEELDSLALPRSPRNDASTIMLTGEPGKPPLATGSSEFVQPKFVEGQLFGKYELLCEVGRGGMGVVYKARQTDLNRVVALKMILSNHLASEDQVRRFYDEARAAGSLKHSHIVGIHEVGELSGQHYFAMDYVEGISLADKLEGKPLPFDQTATCLSKIATAVGYLHRHRIIHRDLKPSNILLDEHCEPYVTDFGLAKIFSDESRVTRTGTIVGTPSYMAPEQAAGKIGEISPRSDVYSLGAILYEMLTGRPPFKERTPLDTLVQVLEGEPALPRKLNPEIPRGLELICLKCLEKRPEDRYQTADDLAADLERFLKSDPLEARSASFEHRVKRWARRSPALAARLAGLVIASMTVQMTYHLWGKDFNYHVQVMSIFAVWAALSLAFQWMLQFESVSRWVAYAWAASDVVLLTWQLCIADPPRGPLLVGYPLLITACGMFFRVRMVLFMTALSVLSYAFLCYTYPLDECERPQYPIIFASVLTITGLVVAYQVYRVRALSRYYESRR